MPDPTPDPVAPDPTQPLSESLGLPAGLSQSQTATPQLAPQGYQGPRPILMDLIQGLIKPKMQAQPGQMARPVSRAATFEDFLGNFVGALGQGFAAAGHGPGAAARGAGAAIGAPLQMQQQQQAFQQQQSQQAAQTQLTQAQAAAMPAELQAKIGALTAQPRFDPETRAYLGTMNDAQYQNYLKGQGAAGVSAGSRVQAAQIGAGAKVQAAQIGQGMNVAVPKELQEQFGVPAQLPLSQLNKLESAANRPLTTIQGANDQFQLNRITGQTKALGVGNPRVAAAMARPLQVGDPTTPGGVKYVTAGEAMRQGMQSASSSTVKVPASVLKDFTSGTSAKTLNSFNTATDHLKILSSLGDALDNGSVPLINRFANQFSTATGGAAPTTFNMAKQAVAGEIAKTFKGQATEGEISAINSTLNAAQSPKQMKGAINTALQLMESKRSALMEQYDKGIKATPAFPQSQKGSSVDDLVKKYAGK